MTGRLLLSTGHSAQLPEPGLFLPIRITSFPLQRWQGLISSHLLSLISDEELELEGELVALPSLASTAAGEQLVVRLEAASLPRDQCGSRCKVEAGNPSIADKE